jgi:hypothetical protein
MASDKGTGKGHSFAHAPEAETTLRPISHAPLLSLRHRLAEGGGEGRASLTSATHHTFKWPHSSTSNKLSDRPLKRSFYAILMQRNCVMSLLIWVQALPMMHSGATRTVPFAMATFRRHSKRLVLDKLIGRGGGQVLGSSQSLKDRGSLYIYIYIYVKRLYIASTYF